MLVRSPEAILEHPVPDEILKWRAAPLQDFCFQSYVLGGVRIDVTSDDVLLTREIAATLGDPAPKAHAGIVLRATFRSGGPGAERGLLDLDSDDRDALTPDDLLLGLDSPEFPFRLCEPSAEGWISFTFLDDLQPLLSFRDGACLIWKRDRWRAAIGFLLLHRIYRLRRDAIFFHAASVALRGQGIMFVGPKGMGKSTTSLALAARDVPLLGDEIACYRPGDGVLEPFLRPVGIKPGLRSSRVDASLSRLGYEPSDEVLRIDAWSLFDVGISSPVPLRWIVFLDSFAAEPRLTRVNPTRDEVALLQPVVSSLVSASRAQRVFQMSKMLSSAMIYRLSPANPDATAELICSELGGESL